MKNLSLEPNALQNILPHLYYFLQVANCESFTGAAARLQISQSAVSYQIKGLEEKLGIELIQRQARQKVRLSEAGQQLANHCRQLYHELGLLFEGLKGEEVRGRLVVTAPVTFGSTILPSLLPGLAAAYPELNVELRPNDTVIDVIAEGIDLALRSGEPQGSGLTSRLLAHEHKCLVASPRYLDQQTRPRQVADLANLQLLLRSQENPDWRVRGQLVGELAGFQGRQLIASTFGLYRAVLDGQGCCLLPRYLVHEDLSAGRLEDIRLVDFEPPSTQIHACFPLSSYRDRKVETFLAALTAFLEVHPGFHSVTLAKRHE